ncbi:type IV pilus assembly protein PilE [Allopseudospirillum japonicum]|uniref:Type IV pilus assembly protein PilE n=1 Tax=Allopseudospirillum japonicum TaxID=64971 RepID=A0A1H6R357_9GAMM|nr:type IV pilin protein [Allopseudospirillum japonicum]SEI46937.1 type IV pilus assembly protein PilE [Allopseudospirillum japonicum]
MYKRHLGMTLIELMIVVAIVGILAAFAYPNYQESVRKSRRADGQALLLQAATRQEEYFNVHRTYADTVLKLYGTNSKKSNDEHYTLNISACAGGIDECFRVTATPQGSQAVDGALWMQSDLQRGPTEKW